MFKDVMSAALDNTEGSIGVVIMGMDGIPVEQLWRENGDGDTYDIAVHEYTNLLRNAKRAAAGSDLGKMLEMTVSSEKGIFVLHPVGEGYFLAMILAPTGNFGRGRYELRRAELLLTDELTV